MFKTWVFIFYIIFACLLGFIGPFYADKKQTLSWLLYIGITLLIISPIVAKICEIF